MMVSRWQIEAHFGHKRTMIDLLQRRDEETGSQIGWTSDKTRLLTGSIGARESTLQSEMKIKNQAEPGMSRKKPVCIEANKQRRPSHRLPEQARLSLRADGDRCAARKRSIYSARRANHRVFDGKMRFPGGAS